MKEGHAMRSLYLSLAVIVSAAVFVSGAVLLSAGTTTTIAQEATVIPGDGSGPVPVPPELNPEALAKSSGAITRQEGIPAIEVRTSPKASEPAFSAADVEAYLRNHPFPYNKPGTPGPVITSVEFMSVKDARDRIGASIMMSDDAVICVVSLAGTFNVPTDSSSTIPTGSRGYLGFDAETGNLLFESIQP